MRAGADPAEAVTLDQVRRLLAARTGDAGARAENPTWLTRFKLHSRMVDRFRRGRVFLAGDAAHLHSPSGGQGITTGMQDAYNLAWKLGAVIRRGAPEALLDTYEEERLPIARQVLAGTDSNTRILFARGRLGKLFRDWVFLPLLRTEAVQDCLVRRLSQLEMSYREARLSQHHESSGHRPDDPASGRVTGAPDVVFARAGTGARTTLFELLQGSGWVALLGAPAFDAGVVVARALQRLGVITSWVRPRGGGAPAVNEDLIDVWGDFQRIYGAEARSIDLIRPDGYAGLVERPLECAGCRPTSSRSSPRQTSSVHFASPKCPGDSARGGVRDVGERRAEALGHRRVREDSVAEPWIGHPASIAVCTVAITSPPPGRAW